MVKLSFVINSHRKEGRKTRGSWERKTGGGKEEEGQRPDPTWPWLKEEVFVGRQLIGRNLARCQLFSTISLVLLKCILSYGCGGEVSWSSWFLWFHSLPMRGGGGSGVVALVLSRLLNSFSSPTSSETLLCWSPVTRSQSYFSPSSSSLLLCP